MSLNLQPGDSAAVVPSEFFCVKCSKPRPRDACSVCGELCVLGDDVRAGRVEGVAPELAEIPEPVIRRARNRQAPAPIRRPQTERDQLRHPRFTDAKPSRFAGRLEEVPPPPPELEAASLDEVGLEQIDAPELEAPDLEQDAPELAPEEPEQLEDLEPETPDETFPAANTANHRRGRFVRRPAQEITTMANPTHRMQPRPELDANGNAVHRMQSRRGQPQQAPGAKGQIDALRQQGILQADKWAEFFGALLGGCQTAEDIATAAEMADEAYLEYQRRVSSQS